MTSETPNNNNLAQLRQAKGLSQSEIANQLKLSITVINKIENSDFKALGAYTYVRGYITNYANFLEVDPQQYLDLVPMEDFIVPLVNTHSNHTKSIKLKRHSKNMASYLIGTFVVLAISFSGWFLLKNYTNHNKNNKATEIVDTNIIEILPKENTITIPVNSQNAHQEESYHLSSIIPTESLNNDIQAIPKKEDALSNEPLNENNLNSIKDGNKQSTSTETSLINSNNTEDDSKQIEQLTYEITIQTDETSWVKVEQIEGEKLHNDLLKPGSITLQSDKPLHFRIGNEDKVKIIINGKEIDTSEFSSKNIADFNWPVES